MTNIIVKTTIAASVIVTNWVSIGTFTSRSGTAYDVLQGQVHTNIVGKMEAEGQSFEHIFGSIPGPTNDVLRLVPIATQGLAPNVPAPLPINPRFIYPSQVIWQTNVVTGSLTNPPPQ